MRLRISLVSFELDTDGDEAVERTAAIGFTIEPPSYEDDDSEDTIGFQRRRK